MGSLILSMTFAATVAQLTPAEFNARFDDSRAELDGYEVTFEVERFDFAPKWGPAGSAKQRRSVWVERQAPRRIVAWEGELASFAGNEPSAGRGELIRSSRDTYWKHNRVGDEELFGGRCTGSAR